jgi:hypothetical protein
MARAFQGSVRCASLLMTINITFCECPRHSRKKWRLELLASPTKKCECLSIIRAEILPTDIQNWLTTRPFDAAHFQEEYLTSLDPA